MNLHSSRELTDQIIAVLQAAGLAVGDANVPASIPANTGFVVVYPLTGGTTDGTMAEAYEDAAAPYQLSSFGGSGQSQRKQCEWVADTVRTTIINATWTLTGRKVIRVAPTFLGGCLRDDSVQPPIFYSPDRYDFRTVPA